MRSTPLTSTRGSRKRLATGTLVLSLVCVAAVAAVGTQSAAGSAKHTAHAAKPAPIGHYGVAQVQKPFMRSSRPLTTTIYYPIVPPRRAGTSGPRFPLILFSHGLGAFPGAYQNILMSWASAGYVVAAPTYPLSNINVAMPPTGSPSRVAGFHDVTNQVLDAKFVIGKVLEADRTNQLVGGTTGKVINEKRIGASGHSLGGITTYGLVYRTCCRDNRVKAAIPMSACAGVVANPAAYFGGTPTPLLIAHSDTDAEISYRFAIQAFGAAQPPKRLLTFFGADHNIPFTGNVPPGYPPSTATKVEVLKHATVDFWDRYLKDDQKALQRLSNDVAVQGVNLVSVNNQFSLGALKCERYVMP
jgi:Platelet-activating factor acetylhydrolase, isoform II